MRTLLAHLALTASVALSSLTLDTYTNTALSGTPAQTSLVDSLDRLAIRLPAAGGSAELTGSVLLARPSYYSFNCSFEGGQVAFLWIADHLVCHTDPPFGNTPSSTDGSPQYPLWGNNTSMSFLLRVYSQADQNGTVTSQPMATVSVQWSLFPVPLPAGAAPTSVAIPPAQLSTGILPAELKRRALQRELAVGWNTWSYNMLGVVRLPESFSLVTAICQHSSGHCLTEAHIESSNAQVRVGPFAADQSYWQYYVGFQGVNVSISISGGQRALSMLVEPVSCSNCSDYALVLLPRYCWFRAGAISIGADGSITLTPLGMPATQIRPAQSAMSASDLPAGMTEGVGFNLGHGPLGFQEGDTAPSLAQISSVVGLARSKELASYQAWGELAEVKEAIQAATLWNFIYSPAEYGPFLPVSRSWNFVKQAKSSDWGYVIFDWDNIFASYMTSLDPKSKAIAYSNFIQVIRSRTARGFVPNYSAGGSKSVDRTEPPIGAKVLLEMFTKYKDIWLVELLYDDLLEWNTWFVNSRMFGPAGIVSLGSDTISGYRDFSPGTMQAGRFESGLDNSPMYDGDFFNASVFSEGSFSVGQMELYDVGFASMFVQEAEALAVLAGLINRTSEIPMLKARAKSQRELIAANLWDQTGGIFTNKFWNGSFYRRISPTSFYSLMAEAATDSQAIAMVKNWLLSPEHFCIAPQGDFAGNHDDCYWGLPSIQRSDPAFPPLGYWRGYVWGPMAQLTYWSLQHYDHVPEVRSGRKALCKQMTALMLSQWHEHRHICENYSPHKTADDHGGDCSGTKFYHWGALNGMITMIEEGYY